MTELQSPRESATVPGRTNRTQHIKQLTSVGNNTLSVQLDSQFTLSDTKGPTSATLTSIGRYTRIQLDNSERLATLIGMSCLLAIP